MNSFPLWHMSQRRSPVGTLSGQTGNPFHASCHPSATAPYQGRREHGSDSTSSWHQLRFPFWTLTPFRDSHLNMRKFMITSKASAHNSTPFLVPLYPPSPPTLIGGRPGPDIRCQLYHCVSNTSRHLHHSMLQTQKAARRCVINCLVCDLKLPSGSYP